MVIFRARRRGWASMGVLFLVEGRRRMIIVASVAKASPHFRAHQVLKEEEREVFHEGFEVMKGKKKKPKG